MNTEKSAYVRQISEVRTSAINGEPETAILTITAGGKKFHFSLSVEDLAGLARRMELDAALLRS